MLLPLAPPSKMIKYPPNAAPQRKSSRKLLATLSEWSHIQTTVIICKKYFNLLLKQLLHNGTYSIKKNDFFLTI